jgi:hypothetical protein
MDGAIPIRASGVTLPAQVAPANDSRVVDFRWIQTRVVRPISYRITERQTALPTPVHPEAISSVGPALVEAAPTVAPDGQATAAAAVSSPAEAYTTVLTLLRSWVKDDDATR